VKTMFSIGFLIVIGLVANFVLVFVLNIAGLPGALIAKGQPRLQSLRWFLGFIIATLGQLYLAAAYVAFIVNWTLLGIKHQDFSPWIFWPIALLVSLLPLVATYQAALREATEDNNFNVAFDALGWAVLLSVPAFFVFIFVPSAMKCVFPWVPYMS